MCTLSVVRIFVAGATGVLGRKALPLLVQAGHTVRGVARGDEKAAQLRALGIEPSQISLFEPDEVRRAVEGCEAVIHIATKIPPMARARKREAWAENDRLRTEATKIMVDASLAAGVRLFIKESVTFTYPDCGSDLITEETPLSEEHGWLQSTYDAERETRRFEGQGRRALILRFGNFQDPTSDQTRDSLALLRRRIAPVVGAPEGYWSIIHVSDAASALLASLGAPSGVYNIVDDEPLTRREYSDAAASALSLRPPRFLPVWPIKLFGGGGVATLLRSQRVSNAKFRRETGWSPRHPSARETWRNLAAALP